MIVIENKITGATLESPNGIRRFGCEADAVRWLGLIYGSTRGYLIRHETKWDTFEGDLSAA